MNRTLICLLCLLGFNSCGSAEFMQEIQGTWKVTEVNYVFDSSTSSYYPTDQFFVFEEDVYQHQQNGNFDEAGTFYINPKATVIVFNSALGTSKYNILEKSETEQ